MVAGGGLLMAREAGDGGPPKPDWRTWVLLGVGTSLCLAAFMAGALLALPRGLEAAFSVRDAPFAWPIYAVGMTIGVAGVWRAVTRPCTAPRA
jgi:hypothetical protein